MESQEFGYMDFGWMNSWGGKKPEEFVRREFWRERLGFELKEEKIGSCSIRYYCEELRYSYKVDSSD